MVRIPPKQMFASMDGGEACYLEDWERYNADRLIELSCTASADRPFQASEINVDLERMQLALVRATPHRVSRDAKMIAARPAGAIAVYAALRGEAILEYSGERRVLRPGQLLVCDVDRPFVRGFGHGLEELAVKVSRCTLGQFMDLSAVAHPLVIDTSSSATARALVRLVGQAVHRPAPVDERAVLELVAVLASGGRIDPGVSHRTAARAYIDEHLTEPDLSATSVAQGTGISERHLSRIFAAADTSVPRQVLSRRLDLAYSLLARGGGQRTIDIARDSGFTSMAHFSQAFVRRFAVHAGDVLRESRRSDYAASTTAC